MSGARIYILDAQSMKRKISRLIIATKKKKQANNSKCAAATCSVRPLPPN
jgi:hypothetical protein